MKSILVVGGGGFIGVALVRSLVSQDYQVRIIDRLSPSLFCSKFNNFELSKIDYFEGDYSEPDLLSVASIDCNCCIHLATTSVPATSNLDMAGDVQANLVKFLSFINIINSTDIRKIIFLSSGGAVYGNVNSDKIKECHFTSPISSYGVVKLAIENYLNVYNELFGFRNISLRVSNPYGAGQGKIGLHGAISTFLNAAIRNEPIKMFGDGEIVRDYIYIDDLTDLIMKCIDYNGDFRVFNAGSGVGTSLNQLKSLIEKIVANPIESIKLPTRKFDVLTNILDITLAKNELDWSPKFMLDSGIEQMYKSILKMQ